MSFPIFFLTRFFIAPMGSSGEPQRRLAVLNSFASGLDLTKNNFDRPVRWNKNSKPLEYVIATPSGHCNMGPLCTNTPGIFCREWFVDDSTHEVSVK